MNNYYNTYSNQGQAPNENLENMYPEIYHQIQPMVVKAADEIRRGGHPLTPDMLNACVDNVIKMSGMWDEDGDPDPSFGDPVVPVQAGFGGRRRNRRGHHNRNTLRDIGRILLLRELFLR